MKKQQKIDINQIKYEASDREQMEKGAKHTWNKFTRFLEKFTEVTFIVTLVANAVWNIVSMFVGDD